MQEQQSTVEKVHRYRCPGCGADLVFEPRDGCLTCPYCERREEISAGAEVRERSYEVYLRAFEDQVGALAPEALEVQCDACSATVTFTPPEVAGACAFCGSPMVVQPRSADPMVLPHGVLPFGLTQAQANERVRLWVASLWFAPRRLKKLAAYERMVGVYLPFWTYDAHTTSRYTGARGEYYYETESYTETDTNGNFVTKEREVRRTRWYSAAGTVSRWFDDILVPATESIAPERLHALEPWDLARLKPYSPAYLAGYKAQRYQVDLAQGFEHAKQLADAQIRVDVNRDIGGDNQRIDTLSTQYSAITFKYLLLPVYVSAYRFRAKVYQVVVNGRTGEVQGARPYSFAKVVLVVLALAFIVTMLPFVFRAL